jgi:formylglycine-generating enzyme required for sulfatase activity
VSAGSISADYAKTLTKDEARRIVINIARLPELLGKMGEFQWMNAQAADFFSKDDFFVGFFLGGQAIIRPGGQNLEDQMRVEGRIKVDAKIIQGAPCGWFTPGGGKTEWFKDHEAGSEMVVVPAGKFTMGSPEGNEGEQGPYSAEGPQHEVTIAKPFAVGKTEVTFAEWDACVAAGACLKASDNGWGGDDRPVINVSWDDAKQYIAWLRRITRKEYRLLSEAEWEYAARAGNSGPYGLLNMLRQESVTKGKQQTQGGGYLDLDERYIPFSEATPGSQERYPFTEPGRLSRSDDENVQLDQFAWYGNSDRKTHPVGKKAANVFGLHDMHGNVMEWVEDTWHDNYKDAPLDGSPWVKDGDAGRRVVRGGSWINYAQDLRAAKRTRPPPTTGSTTSVSGWPERSILDLYLFTSWVQGTALVPIFGRVMTDNARRTGRR